MSMSTSSRSRLKSGVRLGIAALTVLAATAVGTGTASANTDWRVQIINANVPAQTGSVQLQRAGTQGCMKLDTTSKLTTTTFGVIAGDPFSVRAFSDGTCTGTALNAGVSYDPTADLDVKENNLNCDYIAVGVRTAEHHFRICR